MTTYIKMITDEIAQLKRLLEPLESGKFKLHAFNNGVVGEDHTKGQIEGMKRTIKMLQSIVDHENATRS